MTLFDMLIYKYQVPSLFFFFKLNFLADNIMTIVRKSSSSSGGRGAIASQLRRRANDYYEKWSSATFPDDWENEQRGRALGIREALDELGL